MKTLPAGCRPISTQAPRRLPGAGGSSAPTPRFSASPIMIANIAFDATTFEAASGFTSSDIRQSVGLSVDNLDVTGALRSDRLNECRSRRRAVRRREDRDLACQLAQPEQRLLMMSVPSAR